MHKQIIFKPFVNGKFNHKGVMCNGIFQYFFPLENITVSNSNFQWKVADFDAAFIRNGFGFCREQKKSPFRFLSIPLGKGLTLFVVF